MEKTKYKLKILHENISIMKGCVNVLKKKNRT